MQRTGSIVAVRLLKLSLARSTLLLSPLGAQRTPVRFQSDIHGRHANGLRSSANAASSSGYNGAATASPPYTSSMRLMEDGELIPGGPKEVPSAARNSEPRDGSEGDVQPSTYSSSAPPRRPPSAPPTGAYEPWEVRALVLSLLPLAHSGVPAMPVKDVLYLLPSALQAQLRAFPGGLPGYIDAHFASDVVFADGRRTFYRQSTISAQYTPPTADSSPSSSDASAAAASTAGTPPSAMPTTTVPPPPPPSARAGSGFGKGQGGSGGVGNGAGYSAPASAKPPRTTIELLDVLVEYLPTFFVQVDAVAATLPSTIQQLYADTSFTFFLKRFRHYVDLRTSFGNTDVRLRPDFSHPKRGEADARFTSAMSAGEAMRQIARSRLPPRNSEANLIMFLVPRIPVEYTALAEVLPEVSDIVSRHPSFDPRLGVTGLLEKYPEYFQIVDGKLRARPYRSAPFSLDDLDAATSPLPTVYAKLKPVVEAAAEGKQYSEEKEKHAAMVSTGKLYTLLSAEEKALVKTTCRSFPRFLRLHGKEIVVTVDGMRVYLFKPEYERCAETILHHRLAMNSISPDDPILRVPAEMAVDSDADWALRELYDVMPLTQCVELADLLSLVPPALRDALPKETTELVALLRSYPEYFAVWPYPDDPSIMVAQRAKLEDAAFTVDEIARVVLPLIPQGGTELSVLMRRVPLSLQRYFYHHGLRKTLERMKSYCLVSGDRVIRLAAPVG